MDTQVDMNLVLGITGTVTGLVSLMLHWRANAPRLRVEFPEAGYISHKFENDFDIWGNLAPTAQRIGSYALCRVIISNVSAQPVTISAIQARSKGRQPLTYDLGRLPSDANYRTRRTRGGKEEILFLKDKLLELPLDLSAYQAIDRWVVFQASDVWVDEIALNLCVSTTRRLFRSKKIVVR